MFFLNSNPLVYTLWRIHWLQSPLVSNTFCCNKKTIKPFFQSSFSIGQHNQFNKWNRPLCSTYCCTDFISYLNKNKNQSILQFPIRTPFSPLDNVAIYFAIGLDLAPPSPHGWRSLSRQQLWPHREHLVLKYKMKRVLSGGDWGGGTRGMRNPSFAMHVNLPYLFICTHFGGEVWAPPPFCLMPHPL